MNDRSAGPRRGDTAELSQLGWEHQGTNILCINPYPNGLMLSYHRTSSEFFAKSVQSPGQFLLRSCETREFNIPSGRFTTHRSDIRAGLQEQFDRLARANELSQTVIFFGMITDPFLSLPKKFSTTIACLEALCAARVGLVVVQSRSPLILAALPYLRNLQNRVVASLSVETYREDLAARYLPGKPSISERLSAATGLRRQGIQVQLVAAPLLPYGNPHRDSHEFAQILDEHADFITVQPLNPNRNPFDAKLRSLALSERLLDDKQGAFLQADVATPLIAAISERAEAKLHLPRKIKKGAQQMDLFHAA